MTAPLDVQAMRKRHRPTIPGLDVPVPCALCRQDWRCDAIQALDVLGRAERVVEAASRWDHWGKVKAMHVLTCKECERLESAEARWCDEASKIARAQLDAGKALQAALAAHDAEVGR